MKIYPLLCGGVIALSTAIPMAAQALVSDRSYCGHADMPAALRQTMIIVDGQILSPETSDPLVENRAWRAFMSRFVNAADPQIGVNIAPGEMITLAVANADGSGVTPIFSGCVPYFPESITAARQAESSGLSTFFGSDWNAQHKKMAGSFSDNAILAMVTEIRGLPEALPLNSDFGNSTVAKSLAHGTAMDLAFGIPRIILFTDLSLYELPTQNGTEARLLGFAAAENLNADFQYADIHILTAGAPADGSRDYLEAFFLQGRGSLQDLSSASGNLNLGQPPARVEVFNGVMHFPVQGVMHPGSLRLRLAITADNRVVSSWIEENRQQKRYLPFRGDLDCVDGICDYLGDGVFAQIWSPEPGGDPECLESMPLIGMRVLNFALDEDRVTGVVNDDVCVVVGAEEGIQFNLNRTIGGIW